MRADVISAEALAVLARVDASPFAACSPDDLAQLRALVLSSPTLKNAGRLTPDRRQACDALSGVIDPPAALPAPDYITRRGRRVMTDAALDGVPDARVIMIEQGSANVMLARGTYSNLVPPRFDYVVVAYDGVNRIEFLRVGPSLPLEQLPMASGAVFHHDGKRYDTVCTLSGCLFIAVRHPPAFYASPLFVGLAVAGALVGLGLGLIVDSGVARLRSPGRQLRKAVMAGDLDVVYQPIVRIADRQCLGAEALLRWRDTQGRTISPEVFVAIAEQDGFVSELTRFVVLRVLDELAPALAMKPDFHVNINIPVVDLLDPAFARFVARELQRRQVSASSIGLEITERSTAARSAMNQGIQRLRQAGHAVYIDDFGVDYSSLSYLSQLQVDGIKLDRSFIAALGDDSTANIVPQIVQMGQVAGVALVVEGVETEGQAAYLAGLDPNLLGQGWLFSRPLPADRLFT